MPREPHHTMPAGRALDLVTALTAGGVDCCLGGGWAVDALLGRQGREHGDLDLWVPAGDLEALVRSFALLGVDRLMAWGGDKPWNIVLHDGGSTRVDLHLYEPRGDGTWHYGSALAPRAYPDAALRGSGRLLGTDVRCESPEWALRCHTGYTPRPVDRQDVAVLCQAFDLELPSGY